MNELKRAGHQEGWLCEPRHAVGAAVNVDGVQKARCGIYNTQVYSVRSIHRVS